MKRRLLGAISACFMFNFSVDAQAAFLPNTGPDTFGYSGAAITADLRDISTSGAFLGLGDDQTSSALNIGFSFGFYGNSYTTAYVSSNGFMGFTAGMPQGCCSGLALPQTDSVNNLIAGLWEDLNNPQGNIRYQTLGTAGSREFVVGFYDVQHYLGGSPVTFEMILHEGSNAIEFQYGSITSDGGQHSVGIENAAGTDGLQVLLSSSSLDFGNTGYLIVPSAVPIPATVWLFGSGLLGMIGIARRKKAA